jgi:hypothetical protein
MIKDSGLLVFVFVMIGLFLTIVFPLPINDMMMALR